jgi:hypothetical protein
MKATLLLPLLNSHVCNPAHPQETAAELLMPGTAPGPQLLATVLTNLEMLSIKDTNSNTHAGPSQIAAVFG